MNCESTHMLHELLWPSFNGRVGKEELINSRTTGKIPMTMLYYRDETGMSHRYVLRDEGGRDVAALQVMTMPLMPPVLSNVYVVPDLRRRGLATTLLVRAKHDHPEAMYSKYLTDDGKAWKDALTAKWQEEQKS